MSTFSSNTDDLFICGKCRVSFTDLAVFLTHRSTCNGDQAFELLPAPTSVSSSLLASELDAIIQDVCLPISPTANIFYEATHSDMTPTNDFDLLFSSPVEQLHARNESIMSSAADSQILENGILTIEPLGVSGVRRAVRCAHRPGESCVRALDLDRRERRDQYQTRCLSGRFFIELHGPSR